MDFLVFDYLSEVTMSLLTAAQQKNPDLGFAPDFVLHALAPYLKDIKNKGNAWMFLVTTIVQFPLEPYLS